MARQSLQKFKIAITTGDSDGIGTEITSKALCELGIQKDIQFFIWRSPACPSSDIHRFIDSPFTYKKVSNLQEALKISFSYNIIDIESQLSPAKWVEESVLAIQKNQLDSLVTAPLSKKIISMSNPLDKGHTDILKRLSNKKDIFMSFVGEDFAVVLLTDHIPLSKVSQNLSIQRIEKGLFFANQLQKTFFKNTKPIGLLGLNPHAGEHSLIGSEEKDIFLPTLHQIKEKLLVEGPLVPDVAFQYKNRQKYNVFVASYHDQGLIPFKSLHKSHTGVQITMGLNFPRTSVDHGTAKDIFGKDKANPKSMINAIKYNIQLLKNVAK